MAPSLEPSRTLASDTQSSNPMRKAWNEDRIDIHASLKGRGQENASTARHNLEQRIDSRQKSPARTRNRSRQNSLKRVKNSNEVLRQRSVKTNGKDLKEITANVREGRPFKVANVGDNGKIYLRPSVKPAKNHQGSVPAQPFNTPETQYPDSDPETAQEREQKYWSASQASITARHPPISSVNPRGRRSNSISGRSSVLSRDSTSTINPEDALDPGAYRVVIKNGITHTRQADQQMGSLDINIPHYRLGTPRFSTRGTALITSTIYSRSSATDDFEIPNRSSIDIDTVLPPINGAAHPSTNPLDTKELPPPPKSVPMRMPITTIAPVFHRAREPIVPSIYESLHSNPDDPAIVRYAMTTREISAASPARIIAQITSKSFLDYELLSDFFLTVRAYLSTNDLLEYLLARFEWAINRLDDEGRVIRVRSFAAIRHWVLNYFPYDFVVDRDLRVKFCDRLNFLAKQVRRKGHEASDLKLIIDLKKCWNGRCALYWDNIGDDFETRIEHEISPGGIVGSRDSQLTHPNDLWAKLATNSHQPDQEKSVAALHNWVDSVIEAEVDGKSKGERQPSITSPMHTPSFQSEQSSIPATSCVIPTKTMKTLAQAGRHQGPHPVTIAVPPSARRVCPPAPSSQSKEKVGRSKGDHARSGSFSDALRDKRTSLGAIQEGKATEPVVMSLPFSGSLVRGSVLTPGSPFIDNSSQNGSGPSMKQGGTLVVDRSEKVADQPMSPGVRNLLANLRRAWSKQQNVVAATSAQPNLIPPAPFVMEQKHAGLPMHIAHKIEGFGDQHHQLEALKRGARIDLLCADVTDMYERAIMPDPQSVSRKSSIAKLDATDDDSDSPDSWQHIPSPRDKVKRNHSEVTTGSRSIVIVDDTSSEPPVPSIPSPYVHDQSMHDTTTLPLNLGAYSDPTAPADQSSNVQSGQSSALLPEFSRPQWDQPRPLVAAGPPERNSSTLRKYASYQSGIGRQIDRTSVAPSTLDSPEKATMPAGKLLRRIPGGDLKANENVHDMELRPRRGSTGTIATFRESVQEAESFLRNMPGTKPPSSGTMGRASTPVPRRSISLVNPRQSHKDIRRSFERAVAQFARIPDDERGDLEDTLAKLEGKFKSPKASTHGSRSTSGGSALQPGSKSRPPQQPSQPTITAKQIGSQESVLSVPSSKNVYHKDPQAASNRSIYTASEGSYDPTPVVDRNGHHQQSQVISNHSNQSNVTVPRPLFSPQPPNHSTSSISTGRTSDLGSASRIRRGRCRSSIPTMTTDSFLLDEDESLSDISSDFDSDDDDDLTEDGETNSVLEDAYGTSAKSMQGPYQSSSSAALGSGHLPSPPMTTENAMSISSEARRQQEERKPPTPEPSPVSRMTEGSTKSRTPNEVDSCVLQPFANKLHRFPPRRHLPFILSFEPEILAQQFTLIERDALNEINWQDLVDLKWSTTPSNFLNWVEYLRFSDPNGIDLVIARANLMVKWAVSEIVLTHHIEERALTIMKLIRVAQAARKQCNYATLLQLTLALTSQDVQKLKKTWARVPEKDRAAMKDMESLVSPVRNFWNLRHEMDAMEVEGGCVPVVALFLHDLTYNAQKPSVIASTRDSEPLINFERYRTTATIVKSLLRLVDASAKYNYRPVEGALERCLWIASLSDEGIRKRSTEIEAAAT